MIQIFRVVFHGTKYDFPREAENPIGGFYVSVVVDANDVDQACLLAYEKLMSDDSYLELIGSGEHPNALIEVSEVFELSEHDPEDAEISGFIFYPPEDSEIETRH